MRTAILISKQTFKESIRNKWVTYFSVAFALLAFMLSFVGSSETQNFSNFDRSAATLLNVMMLFVPLLGFTLGAQMIAGPRESGTLVYLLSHPISKFQYFTGRFFGAVAALTVSLTLGFAVAAAGMALVGSQNLSSFIVLWIAALFFCVVCASIGMLISVFGSNRSKSFGVAIMAWLAFTVFSDLGLMATAYVLRLRSEGVIALALLNPVEVFKILVVKILATNLEVLGAGGMYLDIIWGDFMPLILAAWLVVIAAGGFIFSSWVFNGQEEY
jgi:ABC-type transport system involved in multi-copper enzyme maturation permease subunit